MATWRCVTCGCNFDQAQAKRRRRHEPPIATVRAQTCSRTEADRMRRLRQERRVRKPKIRPQRQRVRKVRRKRQRSIVGREGYWLRRRYRRLRVPRELAWRCRECGCSFKMAQAKRRQRGEREIKSLLARTCSEACRSSHTTEIKRRWNREHPEGPAAPLSDCALAPDRPGRRGAGPGGPVRVLPRWRCSTGMRRRGAPPSVLS